MVIEPCVDPAVDPAIGQAIAQPIEDQQSSVKVSTTWAIALRIESCVAVHYASSIDPVIDLAIAVTSWITMQINVCITSPSEPSTPFPPFQPPLPGTTMGAACGRAAQRAASLSRCSAVHCVLIFFLQHSRFL